MAGPIKATGSLSFAGGVDSSKSPTVASSRNPNGLPPNELAWLINASVRGGVIAPRDGIVPRGTMNLNLPPQIVPGTPAQSIPQPPIPPVQTPNEQSFESSSSTWVVPLVGASATIHFTYGEYVGNVGDVTQLFVVPSGGPSPFVVGYFLVTGISNLATTLQTVTSSYAGSTIHNIIAYNLFIQSLGPPTPQPPINIPAGQPTSVYAQPYFQGGFMYAPDGGNPYVIAVIGGHVVQVDPDFNSVPLDLSNVFGEYMPVTNRCYFEQAENYLIIQAGDYNAATGQGTLPLFWDGQTLKRSNGLTRVTSINAPVSNFFTLNVVNSWKVPAVGATVNFTLTSPYGQLTQAQEAMLLNGSTTNVTGGTTTVQNSLTTTSAANEQTVQNLNDNLTIIDSGNNTIGVFRVTAIAGNTIELTVISLTATVGTQENPGAFSCTLTIPPTNTATVIIATGNWQVPAVGKKGSLNMTSLYFGSVGDTVSILSADQQRNYGSFTVVSFSLNGFQIVLKTITSNYAGQTVAQTNLLISQTAVRTGSFVEAQDASIPWVIQPVGGVSNLTGRKIRKVTPANFTIL